jgi:hypothetical protein
MAPPKIEIRGFAQLERVDITLGDLTVLVGPQASGKSLVLQLLKLAIDGRAIVHTLHRHDLLFRGPVELLERYFGEGMGPVWTDNTLVRWHGHAVTPNAIAKTRRTSAIAEHEMYFIPAHRTLVLADGYPLAFQQLTNEAPFVVRQFSEAVRQVLISSGTSEVLFPPSKRLKQHVRAKIDDTIFHGARLIEDTAASRRRLQLKVDDSSNLSYMTWTAGQREFIPLLLGAYHLLPKGKSKQHETTWVVIEEPEMGLHPRGISAVMLLVLDLLSRGYKIILSTHAPLVLDVLWALQRLKRYRARWQAVLKLFGIEGISKADAPGEAFLASQALSKDYRTYLLDFDSDRRVTSQDISSLDPSSPDDAIAGWGDLTGLGGKMADVVTETVREAQERGQA